MADQRLGDVRTEFIKHVNKPIISQLLDDLHREEIMDDEEVERVNESNKTQEQARILIDSVRKKGPEASRLFIDFLVARNACLAEQLDLQNFPADQRLGDVRTEFIKRVNKPIISQLLDDLHREEIMDDEEVERVNESNKTQEQARILIDSVRKKGPEASRLFIDFLLA